MICIHISYEVRVFSFSATLSVMTIQEQLTQSIKEALLNLGIEGIEIHLEHPTENLHGDFSTNVALASAKKVGKNPQDVADDIIRELEKNKLNIIEKIEKAGPGFINFYLTKEFFIQSIKEILDNKKSVGSNNRLKNKKVLIEHTSPNAFKLLHIGHFMANAVGEATAGLLEYSGAEVKRATYASDIGLPVAKAVWGMMQMQAEMPEDTDSVSRKVEFIGNAYTHGAGMYESDEEIKKQIDEINIHIYKKDDEDIISLYTKGRAWSLMYLEEMYKKLDTNFDYRFFESEVFDEGSRIVRAHLGKVFEESEGAIVFKGEDYGLHTRVFISSKGAPTYEAKELGLQTKKAEIPYDISIVVTGNEQSAVMEVGLKAFEQIDAERANKTEHISHGLMLGKNGKKMSSRKGGSLSAEELIESVKTEVLKKMKEGEDVLSNIEEVAEKVAVGALKYQILKQGSGKNIVFDIEQALSFEGDSGPYLQYTYARTNSLLEKGKEAGIEIKTGVYEASAESVYKLIYQFSEVVERAGEEYTPQTVTTFLMELASRFNAYYAGEKIIDIEKKEKSSEKLALVDAVNTVLKRGLVVLGIPAVERM